MASSGTEKQWAHFWQATQGFLGSPCLVFSFLDGLSGISYQLATDGVRQEFHSSPYLVRDRAGLANNGPWQEHGHLFKKKFVVGCGDTWCLCTDDVWSPSADAVFLLEVLNARGGWGRPRSILDFGCGTGVLGIAGAREVSSVEEVSLVDSSHSALAVAAVNFAAQGLTCRLRIQSDTCELPHHDLGLVTPYYFPIERTPCDDPLARIDAAGRHTSEMVAIALSICQRVIFVYSSVTQKQFESAATFEFRDVASLELPFSLGDNVSTHTVVGAAVAAGLLLPREDDQFPYWHRVTVAEATHAKG
jgi:hypothetical protein